MARPATDIRIDVREMKAGPDWIVVLMFPDRPEMHVHGFTTEADAKNWITNDSPRWAKTFGYE